MKKILMPIAFALTAIAGVVIGNLLSYNSIEKKSEFASHAGRSKLDMVLGLIDRQYVDTVDVNDLTEKAIPVLLANLDPHTVYIPADELQMVNDDLEASFSGIGVQFNIQRDTVMVVAVIHGGPSEKIGILPGDRIVEVDDSSFVGKSVTNEKVVKKLRGPKNTKVKVVVKRYGADEVLHYTITRGDVPTTSIDARYLIEPSVGYVKVNKFGTSTYEEFYKALSSLSSSGAQSFIIDLRENSGGYLESAIAMINEFLGRDELIVYTEGKAHSRQTSKAYGDGDFQNASVAILIDEWSASASEIFAGAIQDNDRGIVVGRRSFGKGLVQQQIPMSDGSALRLTIARYYTPSGRCIQKPYSDKEGYAIEVFERYKNDDVNSDSVRADTLKYFTKMGRVVYGGGGITPDVVVPIDTVGANAYYRKLYNTGTLYG